MPEFTVKEVRLPELHLPEIKRDDIVRSLSGVRLPDVDLARGRPVRLKVPAFAITGSDLGRLVAAGVGIARLARPARQRTRMPGLPFVRGPRFTVTRLIQPRTRRSRWPMVILIAGTAAVVAWALLRRPSIRRRIDAAARDARERWATLQTAGERLEIESDALPIADRGSEMASNEDPSVSASPTDGDGLPAFEETGKPI